MPKAIRLSHVSLPFIAGPAQLWLRAFVRKTVLPFSPNLRGRSGAEALTPSKTKDSNAMCKKTPLALAFLALIGLAPMLGACQTVAGAGEDISAGGHAVTNSAEKHAP
jgi:entericidin B